MECTCYGGELMDELDTLTDDNMDELDAIEELENLEED